MPSKNKLCDYDITTGKVVKGRKYGGVLQKWNVIIVIHGERNF